MPTTACIPQLRLDFHSTAPIDVTFDGPRLSSDGGLLLLRQVDDQLGLSTRFGALLRDDRDPERVVHPRLEQVRQRLYQIALGYEDANDATTLRHDPLLQVACDRAPTQADALSSQPTLSRLETRITGREVVALQRALEADYVAALPADTDVVVLDVDATADPAHGQHAFAFFHGHYDQTIFFPMLVFDGAGRLVSLRLRPGNAGGYRYAWPMLERVIRALKARLPAVAVVVRGDAGFGVPRLLDGFDALAAELGAIDYVFGLQKNAAVMRHAADAQARAAAQYTVTKQPTRTFVAFAYAAKSWPRTRHVVAKAEHLADGPNPRFVVTTLAEFPARVVYEWAYCARGQAENAIKDLKNALHADCLSCTRYLANAFRLLLHAAAYRLLSSVREHLAALAAPLATAQFDTLRLRLLKVAAFVRQTVGRVVVQLPRAFGLAPLLRELLVRTRLPRPAS